MATPNERGGEDQIRRKLIDAAGRMENNRIKELLRNFPVDSRDMARSLAAEQVASPGDRVSGRGRRSREEADVPHLVSGEMMDDAHYTVRTIEEDRNNLASLLAYVIQTLSDSKMLPRELTIHESGVELRKRVDGYRLKVNRTGSGKVKLSSVEVTKAMTDDSLGRHYVLPDTPTMEELAEKEAIRLGEGVRRVAKSWGVSSQDMVFALEQIAGIVASMGDFEAAIQSVNEVMAGANESITSLAEEVAGMESDPPRRRPPAKRRQREVNPRRVMTPSDAEEDA